MPRLARHLLRTACLAISAWALCSPVHAVSGSITLYRGDECWFGSPCVDIYGGALLSLPSPALATLGGGLEVSQVSPGVLALDPAVTSVELPIQSISGSYENDEAGVRLTPGKQAFLGGVTLSQAHAGGGSLTLSNFKIDLTTNGIYATVVQRAGAPDAVTKPNLRILDYGIALGEETIALRDGDLLNERRFSDLTLTQEGLAAFRQAFQLSEADIGPLSLRGGSLAVSSFLSVSGLVPEPATWALMGLGLAGLAFARRRDAPPGSGHGR